MARIKNPEYIKTMRLKFRRAFTTLLQNSTWEQITIKDICAQANVSPGLFYYYYDSKEAVMRDKYRAFDESIAETVRALAEDSNLYESIFLYARVYAAKCLEKGSNYMAQMIKYYLDDSDHTWQAGRAFFQVLVELIDRAKKSGEIPDKLPSSAMAYIFASALRGQIIEWCAAPENVDLTAHCRELVRFFYLGWKQLDHPIFNSVPREETSP